MKPAAFAYHAPASVGEVTELLSVHDDAKILAGGQSLVPTMNFRLARPAVIVDINRLPELDAVESGDGVLEIGALARHSRFEHRVEPGRLGTLLARVSRFVGHHPIRIRGTFVGSVAHADPAAEWCVVARALDATMIAQGPGGERAIAADTFFHSLFSTDLSPDEILTHVRLPLLSEHHGVGFAEFARRAGDFGLVMAVVVCEVIDGVVRSANVGLGGVSDRPLRVAESEAALIGRDVTPDDVDLIARSAAAAAADSVTPLGDIHGSAEYRTDLIHAMVRRAASQALTP